MEVRFGREKGEGGVADGGGGAFSAEAASGWGPFAFLPAVNP